MYKIGMIAFSALGLGGSLYPMEQFLAKPKESAIRVFLADGQQASFSQGELDCLKALCSEALKENLIFQDGSVLLPGLSKDELEVIMRRSKNFPHCSGPRPLFFSVLDKPADLQECKTLVRAAHYLGIEELMNGIFAFLEENIITLVLCNHVVAGELLRLPFARKFSPSTALKALLCATEKGYREVAELLLEYGADIDGAATPILTIDDKVTPLMSAAQHGHMDLVEMLLDHGASVEVSNPQGEEKRKSAFSRAARNGHKDISRLLFQRGAVIDVTNNDSLHLAAFLGHVALVEELLNRDHSVVFTNGGFKISALISACEGGHEDVVALLLAHGYEKFRALRDTLTEALEANPRPQEIAQLLLKRQSNMNVARLIFEAKQSFVKLLNVQGKAGIHDRVSTALCEAVRKGHEGIVKLLLSYGAEIDSEVDGMTALMYAAAEGNKAMVALLLDFGAQVNPDDMWQDDVDPNMVWVIGEPTTALSLAEEKGYTEIVALLKARGAF